MSRREASYGLASVVSFCAVPPSTSGCPLPMYTSIAPLLSVSVLTLTY